MNNGKIALIDDEPLLIRILTDILDRVNVPVESFSNASDALANLIPHLNEYSCVITDFEMPELSGIDLAKKIREVSFDFPIIISSGDRNLLDDDELMHLRINSVLKKPFTKIELFNSLQGIINIPHHLT